MKTYKQFLEFIGKNFASFIFVIVFYSLWLAIKKAQTFDAQLTSFPDRMIGEATLNAYDINNRITIFYTSGLIFFFCIFFFFFLAWKFFHYSKEIFSSTELQIINYTSIAGIIFYFFNLWNRSFDSSLELVFCIHKVAIAGFILKWLLLRNKPIRKHLNATLYSMAFVLGVSVFFVLTEFSVLFQLFPKPDFFITLFVTVMIILIALALLTKDKDLFDSKSLLNRIFNILVPLSFIPVLSFLKDELYLVLNRHEIYYWSPRKLYALFVFCALAVSFWRYKKFNAGNFLPKTNDQLLALRYFPILVVGIATYTFYSPFIYVSNEMFEAGNRFLPLMEFQKFGVLPIFEKFNSHVLSELFFGSIYAFFNGMHSREMLIYDFLYQVFWAFMVYHFMYKFSRNPYIALFSILLLPIIDSLLSDYAIISLLAVFLTCKVIEEKASFKNYFVLICGLAFLILWRVDIGYPSVIASALTLLVYQFSSDQFRINWKLVFKSFVVFSSIVLCFLFFVSWIRGINVFQKLIYGLNYLGSSQSYGHVSMGDAESSIYKMQYFIFPLIIVLGVVLMLFFFKKYTVSRSQRFIYSSLLFLSVYYFVNFQRGLVRHSFIEGNDNSLSSFMFFLFGGSVFLFYHHRSKALKLIIFCVVSTLLLMNYKFPVTLDLRNVFSKTIAKFDSFGVIEPRPNIVRCIDTTNFEERRLGEFKKVVSTYLSDTQTFIDFANQPMLYYYTGKISPSYFYQNPLTIHNDFLQKSFLSELRSYDVPLLVFSSFPENWWDNTDGVPNTARHYRLAEYFYQYYEPFIIADKLCVWKKKNLKLDNKQKVIYSYFNNSDSSIIDPKIRSGKMELLKDKRYLIKAVFNGTEPEIQINSKSMPISVKADFVNIIDHAAYYILTGINEEFSIVLPDRKDMRSVVITECDFVPDFYSAYPQKDILQFLPAVWGAYDKEVNDGEIISELSSSTISLAGGEMHYFNFKNQFDKKSGNIIMVTLETDNSEPIAVDMVYGGSRSGYKGSYSFVVSPGKGVRNFALRVSSHYNWYDPTIDYIGLVSSRKMALMKLKLLKGN